MAKTKLFIDLGHYAKVPGAKGEIEWTRKIAANIESKINKAFMDILWVPTFENIHESGKNLNERTRFVRENTTSTNDMLISIHGNSSENPQANGVETYFAYGKPLAKTMEQEAIKLSTIYNQFTGTKVRGSGAKPDNTSQHPRLALLQDTIPRALLLEAGFLSNKQDMAVDPDRVAEAIAFYFNSFFPKPNPNPMPSPVDPVEEELKSYVSEFEKKEIIKSGKDMNAVPTNREMILIIGRSLKAYGVLK